MDRDRGGRLSSGLTGRSCALFLVCVTALTLSVAVRPFDAVVGAPETVVCRPEELHNGEVA
jgi:hypothetical protein